jgi:exodeoxyribonuclease-1
MISDHAGGEKFVIGAGQAGPHVESFGGMTEQSFLWFDFETFGADPRRDRPAQFAARRTNLELEPIGEAEVLYCRPADDVLPQPMACLITGITPQEAHERGRPENEFASRIASLMTQPGTCSVGYNNFRFDDEVVRHLFWRNFIDPYEREWAGGNSRFDLIDLMRLTRAVRPEGITWPDYEDGRPSYRLEDLAAANGMDTSRAHDALADVDATIEMARLLRRHQPRLWDWALGLRDRNQVDRLLTGGQPLLHASSRFPAVPGCGVAPILPLAPHPFIKSQRLVWNLTVDPTPFLELDTEALADRYWVAVADLPEGVDRVPVKLVRNNRCPMLAPMNVLGQERATELGISLDAVAANARRLQDHPEFIARLAGLFEQRGGGETDAELDLYGGFVPREDKPVIRRVRGLDGSSLKDLTAPFRDERLNTLLFRYRARLWPETLDADERDAWDDYRRHRLISDPELGSIRLAEYREEISRLAEERPEAAAILERLTAWPDRIGLSRTAELHGTDEN